MKQEKDFINAYKENNPNVNKKKRLFGSPNSSFIEIKCGECQQIRTTFDHAKTIIKCKGCGILLGKPTGGKLEIHGNAKYLKLKNHE